MVSLSTNLTEGTLPNPLIIHVLSGCPIVGRQRPPVPGSESFRIFPVSLRRFPEPLLLINVLTLSLRIELGGIVG
jgi:hypothetical protein